LTAQLGRNQTFDMPEDSFSRPPGHLAQPNRSSNVLKDKLNPPTVVSVSNQTCHGFILPCYLIREVRLLRRHVSQTFSRSGHEDCGLSVARIKSRHGRGRPKRSRRTSRSSHRWLAFRFYRRLRVYVYGIAVFSWGFGITVDSRHRRQLESSGRLPPLARWGLLPTSAPGLDQLFQGSFRFGVKIRTAKRNSVYPRGCSHRIHESISSPEGPATCLQRLRCLRLRYCCFSRETHYYRRQ
jgi:hypothetical protein